MKAVVAREHGQLAVETVPDPTPRPGDLVLRVSACGISGSDLRMHQRGLIGQEAASTLQRTYLCSGVAANSSRLVFFARRLALAPNTSPS